MRSGAGRGILGLLLLLAAGCVSTRDVEVPPDEHYGHRYEDEGPAGRRTLTIEPAAPDRAYFYYPVIVDSLHIRPAPFDPDLPVEAQEVRVEVLVKGSFPDGCYQLHRLEQERLGHLINVTLEMRRLQGAVCTMAIRPYRYYFQLEGTYPAGSYRLMLNETPYPFQVTPPAED